MFVQPGLDPKARAATEAKMAKMQAEHDQHKREELERKMAVKYHKVSLRGLLGAVWNCNLMSSPCGRSSNIEPLHLADLLFVFR